MKKIKAIFASLLFIMAASFATAKPIEVAIRNCTSNEYIAICKFASQDTKKVVAPGETKTYTLEDSYDYAVVFDYDPDTKTVHGDAILLLDKLNNHAYLECGYEDGNLPVVYVTYRYSLLL